MSKKKIKVTTKMSPSVYWSVTLEATPGGNGEPPTVCFNVDGLKVYGYAFAGPEQVKDLHEWLGKWLAQHEVKQEK